MDVIGGRLGAGGFDPRQAVVGVGERFPNLLDGSRPKPVLEGSAVAQRARPCRQYRPWPPTVVQWPDLGDNFEEYKQTTKTGAIAAHDLKLCPLVIDATAVRSQNIPMRASGESSPNQPASGRASGTWTRARVAFRPLMTPTRTNTTSWRRPRIHKFQRWPDTFEGQSGHCGRSRS